MTEKVWLAVIGGSGLYDMPGLSDVTEHNMSTPFGQPSSPIIIGTMSDKRVAFLARHGVGHQFSPTEVNYRANIYALKTLGVKQIVSISACGSLREDFAPGHVVIPNQLYDNTKDRKRTFFEDGLVAHISVADPFCEQLSANVWQAAKDAGAVSHQGGGFITIEGPRFSTRAESNIFRSWGMSIIGMTTSPEAFLAREAEMCYAVMAHVTDYDVWHISEASVTVEMVIQTLIKNTQIAQNTISNLVASLPDEHDCRCHSALSDALITNRQHVSGAIRKKLGVLVDKYL